MNFLLEGVEAVDNTRCSATRAVQRVRPPCPPPFVPRAHGQLFRSPGGSWSSSLRWGGTRKRPWNLASSVHLGPRCKPGRKLPEEAGQGVIDALSCLGWQPGLLSWRRRPVIPGERDSDKDAEKKPGVSRRWKWGAVLGLILASQQLTLSRAWDALARVSSCAQKESIKPTKMLLCARHWGSARKNNQGSSFQRHSQGESQVRQRVRVRHAEQGGLPRGRGN